MMDWKGHKCVSCHKLFKEGDDIVVCPECGAPYHRACYAAEGRCVLSAKHGIDFEYIPPEAKPDVNAGGPVCPACRAQNPPDALFCERCGRPMRPGAAPVPPQEHAPHYAAPDHNGSDAFRNTQYAADSVMTQLHLAQEYDGIATQDWMTYIGNSAPYYLYQFQRMNESGRRTSFCWSALFLPEFYFFYRKMWGWGFAALAVSLIVSLPLVLTVASLMGVGWVVAMSEPMVNALFGVCGLLNWGTRIAACLFAFYLFRQSAAKRMRSLRREHEDDDGYREALKRRGGPSLVVAVLVGVLLTLGSAALCLWAGPERLLMAVYG